MEINEIDPDELLKGLQKQIDKCNETEQRDEETNKRSIYDANDTMRLIGKQSTEYLYYNDGLYKIDQVLTAYHKVSNYKRHIKVKPFMYDTYLLGFIQGMKYARGKAK